MRKLIRTPTVTKKEKKKKKKKKIEGRYAATKNLHVLAIIEVERRCPRENYKRYIKNIKGNFKEKKIKGTISNELLF